jgi:hypothetical protein
LLDLGSDGRINIEWLLKKSNGRVLTVIVWIRIWINGDHQVPHTA